MARRATPDLSGRVVVVTGADGDEGAAKARALCEAGAAVVLCGTDPAALGALAGELAEGGGRAGVFAGDPADDTDRAALIEMVNELFPDSPDPARATRA